MKRYGQENPPQFPLQSIKVPIAKFTGSTDKLGDPGDNKWLSEQIKDVLVHDKTYDYGHLTFFIGKDMVWLDDATAILKNHPAIQADAKENIKSLLE